MILAVAACVVIVVAVSLWLTKKPQPEQPPELPIAQESVGKQTDSSRKPIGASAAGSAKTPSALVISVVGKVAKPGLVTVPVGSRVADALEAAGGVNPNTDVTMLNLARLLDDGEQLVVGIANPAQEPVSGDSSGENKKVDLNTATADQLDKLPGVGEVTVQRILQWRAQHGRFTKVEQLRDVDGIGESKFSKLRAQVVVR
jgi:competence protein ComEA